MLKHKTKIIVIFAILVLLCSSYIVFAENNTVMPISSDNDINQLENNISNSNQDLLNQQNSYKKSDEYLIGDNVTVDYIIDGNLFIFANNVTINSQIGGDAFIVANNITIEDEAYIFSNLFAAAKSIDIKGVVYDVYSSSDTFSISGGYVYRDLRTICNTLNINGSVGRNAFVSSSNINFGTDSDNKGIIYGNLNYTSKDEISIPDGSVSGDIKFTNQTFNTASIGQTVAHYIYNLGAFLSFVLIIWLICNWLTPKFLNSTNNYVGKKTLGILGIGVLTLIAVPIACILLLFLRITTGISLLLLALYFVALALSKTLFTIAANKYICTKLKINKFIGMFGMLIATAAVLWVITKIPFVGPIVSLIMIILGLGILIAYIIPVKAKSQQITTNNK